MSERDDHDTAADDLKDRPITYCLVPVDLAGRLHDLLREHFRDDPAIEVVVELRRAERRSGAERRRERRKWPAADERRAILGRVGRRAGGRRADAVPLGEAPELPRRARRYADRLRFLERVEPAAEQLEDTDTARQVARFQAGEQDSFDILYSRYFDRVYGYMRVVLRDSHEAEDAAQQVFTKVFEALPRYESSGPPFRAWLFTIVRNQAITRLRKAGHVELVAPDEMPEDADPAGSEADLSRLDWLGDRDLILFVERLPITQRQVLLLRFGMDLTSRQVGEILGLNAAQVRSLQRHALAFLRERLSAVGRDTAGMRYRPGPRMRRWGKQAVVLRRRRFALLRR